MHYLFLGDDHLAKDQKIRDIRNKIFNSKDAPKFDYENLQAIKLDPGDLKKALITLPTIAKKRLIVIRVIEKLTSPNKKLILDFIQSQQEQAVLILDSDNVELKNSFVNQVKPIVNFAKFQKTSKLNVFDMTRAMTDRHPAKALKILSGLLAEGNHPLQIMGGLIWFWGNSKNRLAEDNFKKGLVVLQEADLNIKRSRLKPEHAMEVLVAKLCLLIVC